MKKCVYFLLMLLCMLPLELVAQNAGDDLYFVPSKEKQVEKKAPAKKVAETQPANRPTSEETTVIIKEKKSTNVPRDIDEYNRRYEEDDASDSEPAQAEAKTMNRGEWVGGEFEGTEDDYEYAMRIIRFRNPRFAISINSPLYWDLVYGVDSWYWNVYTDGFYAYAFPTFSNPLWWDWRYNSFWWDWNWGWGWGGRWWHPYSDYAIGYWNGWHAGMWAHHYHRPHYYWDGPAWGGVSRPYYRGRSVLNANNRSRYSGSSVRVNRGGTSSRYSTTATGRRVTSTRSGTSTVRSATGSTRVSSSRRDAATYTRPSTNVGNSTSSRSSSVRRSTPSSRSTTPTYSTSRGSSTYTPSSGRSTTTRRSTSTYTPSSRSTSTRRSTPTYTPSRSSSTSTYSPSRSSGSVSRSSSGSVSRSSSSRSSGGSGGRVSSSRR